MFALGYSHPVVFPIPEGIKVRGRQGQTGSPSPASTASGWARWRRRSAACASPIPYKQKGIRYVGEVLKKKAGKAGATGAK